ncbi:MAG: hypothetical protein AAFZ15_20870 [Bacteroidota bacterium]
MIYIVYSNKNEILLNRIGIKEIQHYSDLKYFLPLLEQRGTVVQVEFLQDGVESVFQFAKSLGESAICIFFSEQDRDFDRLQCPKIIFPSFIPPPVWDHFHCLTSSTSKENTQNVSIITQGNIIDTNLPGFLPKYEVRLMPLERSLKASWYAIKQWKMRLGLYYLLRKKSSHFYPSELIMDGVVYTLHLRSADRPGKWKLIINDFCDTFKNTTGATLVIKAVGSLKESVKRAIFHQIKRKSISGRIILINEHLSQQQYEKLIDVTAFIINFSTDRKVGKSILEFISAGKPAISLVDNNNLLNTENSFIPSVQNKKIQSIKNQLLQSFKLFKENPKVYQKMSIAASLSTKKYCSLEVVKPEFFRWLDEIETKFINDQNS